MIAKIRSTDPQLANLLLRREFLGLTATGIATALLSELANATTEVWEEGDPLCAVPDPPLEKPNGYELDRGIFGELCRAVSGADRNCAAR
jgi:hypothetical protein